MAVGAAATDAMGKAFGIHGQCQLPTLDVDIDQAAIAACTHLQVMHAKCSVTQALVNGPGVQRTAARQGQKFAGVFALIISASSGPMFLKLCGRVVGM